MKNIKILLLFFLYVQLIISCEKKEYTIVPLNHQVVKITSRDGLYRLACDTKGEWNELSQQYKISPSAVVEYICQEDKIDSYGYHNVNCLVNHYKEKYDKEKYDALIEQIITEIQNKNQKKSILEDIREKFHKECIAETNQTYQEIKDIVSDYENKRATYTCRIIIGTTIAVSLLCGWIPVGLFSWVINHCHHPWGE